MTYEFMTVDELAAKLQVPKSWIYGQTRQTGPGSIPRLRVGRYLRFRIDEVIDWLENKQSERNCGRDR